MSGHSPAKGWFDGYPGLDVAFGVRYRQAADVLGQEILTHARAFGTCYV